MKVLLPIALFVLLSTHTFSQAKLGLRFSPALSSNRIFNASDTLNFNTDGSKARFMLGLIGDFNLTETYAFSTGLIFVPKRIAFSASGEGGSSFAPSTESYRVHYLQIPLTLKLFTNEIQPDMKLYFQIGGTADIKIFDEPAEEDFDFVSKFAIADANVLLGFGLEYAMGINTILFGGFSYYRGLLNTVDTTLTIDEPLEIRNDLITLDLGIKF